MPHLRLVAVTLVLLLGQTARVLAAEPPKAEKQRITAASGVKLRATPGAGGQEVARLFIGTEVRELERSERQETVGGKTDHWYRVATPEGQEGWVFGAFVPPFEPEQRVKTYVEIANQRMADEKAPFVDRADLANFLKRVVEKESDKASAARLELVRWRAVRWALEAISSEVPKATYEPWAKRQGEALVYSELSGEWLVKTSVLWKLEEKYRGLPEAEAFAWDAATAPTQGECEGYVPCSLNMINTAEGEYLRRYPSGPHAEEALKNISEALTIDESITELDKDGRAELHKELKALEGAVAKVKPEQKKKILEQMKAMRKATGG
ncbi:SH3 domain-containing protein [Archangium violaceum]|uniref:SH3 domain-containing protein n=1 Tax=Archangium violaceum TaxID=83451 RepID=UPI001950AF58|nr:SH3 domain-containing protein [Archangium violaceum]QRN97331.1 SH3 domain-containing protein [Archangium violaceum]